MSQIALVPVASEQQDILSRYMQFYLYDYALFDGRFPENGMFDYPWLAHYFTDDDRAAFFITVDDQIVGFVLLRLLAKNRTEIAEFFVLNTYRKRGIGREVCQQLFKLYPGAWHLGEDIENTGAIAFWRNIAAQCCDSVEETTLVDDDGRKRIEHILYV